jgi:hypothetical protein
LRRLGLGGGGINPTTKKIPAQAMSMARRFIRPPRKLLFLRRR